MESEISKLKISEEIRRSINKLNGINNTAPRQFPNYSNNSTKLELVDKENENFSNRKHEINFDKDPPSLTHRLRKHVGEKTENPLHNQLEANHRDGINYLLRSSLFPNIPPYIRFNPYNPNIVVSVNNLDYKTSYKWQLSMNTPSIVKNIVANSGFVLLNVEEESLILSREWHGIWGKPMKHSDFKRLKYKQKINHFPGSFHLGKKDKLWRDFQTMIHKYGLKEFGFVPCSYVLPLDLHKLQKKLDFNNNGGNELWIVKSPNGSRGTGIKVINKWKQLPKNSFVLVQKYICNPYLINGRKFDLRLYVLVTSFNPLRIYLYRDGLVRFAAAKYTNDVKNLSNSYVHLTNYSINKWSYQYRVNTDANACRGHKWTISKLVEYLEKRGVECRAFWNTLEQLVIKTMIACENKVVEICEENMNNTYNCYEVYGFDVLLDNNLEPWLLEVNTCPDLNIETPLDCYVKGPLVQTILDIAQFHPPPTFSNDSQYFNPKIYTTSLTEKERKKHICFLECQSRDNYLNDILNELTGDDVRHLVRAEDELVVKGPLDRIFPNSNSFNYLKFMEKRYYNRLFDAWETKYADRRQEGIQLLQTLCGQRKHL